MYSKSWLIIRDDVKRTFEVCGQDSNTNHFMREVLAMQKNGMGISGLTPPVTNQHASKESMRITGYSREEGLYQRLLQEYKRRLRDEFGQWEGTE